MSKLSPFQREKLEYFFKFFDTDGSADIEIADLAGFMERVFKFTGWAKDSKYAKECLEIHETFFEILTEKATSEGHGKVDMQAWLDLWERILPGCKGVFNFPVWLRLLPKSLFKIIDKNDDGIIDKDELEEFYEEIVHIDPKEAGPLAKTALEQMTDFGHYPLDEEGYDQIFANFLLGRTPYGPGRFIFGCFEHVYEKSSFTLIQGAPPEVTPEPGSCPGSRRNSTTPGGSRRGSVEAPRIKLVLRSS